MGQAPTRIFLGKCCAFLCFLCFFSVVFMFPNVSTFFLKKLDTGVGGWCPTNPSFSWIFDFFYLTGPLRRLQHYYRTNRRCWTGIVLMLGQRRRWWANIKTTYISVSVKTRSQPTAGLMLGQRRWQQGSIKSTLHQCSEFCWCFGFTTERLLKLYINELLV